MVDKKLEILEDILIDAPRELVYRFFTEAELLCRWNGISAEVDPQPGGIFNLNVIDNHYKVGEFVELDPPSRLVFTWGHPEGVDDFPPGSSTVTVTLTTEGDKTRISLHQVGFPNIKQRDCHSNGWKKHLDQLARVATNKNPP